MPPPAVVAIISVVALGYVPETGLDHLHLHVGHGREYVHDHPHVGHHEHTPHQLHPGAPADAHDDHDSESDGRSAVVSYAPAAQERPPAVEVTDGSAPVEERLSPEADSHDRPAAVHTPWSQRGPPA